MKSLVSYIEESLDRETFFRLNINGIDGHKELADEIVKSGILDGFGVEKTDYGIRVKFGPDNIDKAQAVIDKVNDFISKIPSEDHDNIGKTLAKLVAQLDNLQKYVDDDNRQSSEEE